MICDPKRKSPDRKVPAYITKLSRKMRAKPTDAEATLWKKISNRQLDGLRFRRQFSIGRFIADFYNHENRLIVEIDGDIHANRREYDANRTRYITAHGYRVVRFSNEQVMKEIEAVLEEIKKVAEQKTKHDDLKVPLRGI
jgi:very-short-patch-repair endonuclease